MICSRWQVLSRSSPVTRSAWSGKAVRGHFVRVDGRYQTTENPVLVPGAGLEPAWSRLRGIFVLATAFAAEPFAIRIAHLESGLSLCRAPPVRDRRAFRQGPSSLYTFRARRRLARLSSGLQSRARGAGSPNLTPFTPGVSAPGAQFSQVPCVYQFRHPGSGCGPIVSHAERTVGQGCRVAATPAGCDGRVSAGVC